MGFIGSLKRILEIFYSRGSYQFLVVFLLSFSGIIIELICLFMLYLVVSHLIQLSTIIIFPLFHFQISTYNGVLVLVGVYLLKFIFSIWQNKYLINFCYAINYKITSKIIEHYYNQPSETFKNNKLADALNKVFTIGGFFSEIIFQSVLVFFSELLLTVILIVALLIFNYKLLFLLAFVLIPVCWVLLYFSRKKLKTMSDRLLNDNVAYHQSVMTLFMGLPDIRLSGRFSHFFNIFNNKINALHTTRKVITLENYFPSKVLEFVAVLGIALLFFISNYFGNNVYMAGLLAAFATATFRFIPSVNRIISSVQNLHLYTEYIQFIYEIKDEPGLMDEGKDVEIEKIDSIELKNISYQYPANKVLADISLNLRAGKIIGVTGPSGTGKTTLVNIISGVLKPHAGEMYLNNEPITGDIRNGLSHKSAYVMQDPYFFNGNVIDNVMFGSQKRDGARIRWCLESVNMEAWLKQQPEGFETQIGENGVKLSGGQKQRLAIARALYRKASVLILDEPSNSLDQENKRGILLLLKNLTEKENLITIIVSHDEEVLLICDSVYELNTGQLTPLKK